MNRQKPSDYLLSKTKIPECTLLHWCNVYFTYVVWGIKCCNISPTQITHCIELCIYYTMEFPKIVKSVKFYAFKLRRYKTIAIM